VSKPGGRVPKRASPSIWTDSPAHPRRAQLAARARQAWPAAGRYAHARHCRTAAARPINPGCARKQLGWKPCREHRYRSATYQYYITPSRARGKRHAWLLLLATRPLASPPPHRSTGWNGCAVVIFAIYRIILAISVGRVNKSGPEE